MSTHRYCSGTVFCAWRHSHAFLCALSSSPILWLMHVQGCAWHTRAWGDRSSPPAICLKHVLHGIKMRRKKFLWEGGLGESLWAGERPLDWGGTPWLGAFLHPLLSVFLCCTHPSLGSPCCCSISPHQAVGTSSGHSYSYGSCGLGNRNEDRPADAEQISDVVGWSHSSTRKKEPREVTARTESWGLGGVGC